MEWRIRKSSRGFYAEHGVPNDGENHNPFIMSPFIVYESIRFDTLKKATQYVERRSQNRCR